MNSLLNLQKEKLNLENYQNFFYTGVASVGDKEQQFEFIFDTGSTLIFVNSIYCADKGCLKGNKYDSDKSLNHEDLLQDSEVTFGSGTLKGAVGKDTFYIGNLEIPGMKFLEITS